jgi:hypothetical protein
LTVGASRGRFGGATGPTADSAKLRCHPSFGAEYTLQQRGQIEMSVEPGKVNPESGRADIYLAQVGRSGVLQALRKLRRKCQLYAGVQAHDDTLAPPIIPRRYGNRAAGAALSGSLGRLGEFINLAHESFSIRSRASGRFHRGTSGSSIHLDARSRNFPGAPPAPGQFRLKIASLAAPKTWTREGAWSAG